MKKLWNKNRVLFFLLTILLICFVAIVIVASTFFYSKNTSKYGERLADIDKHPISNEVKSNFKEAVEKDKTVKDVTFDIIGRVAYVIIDFDEKAKLESAQKLISESLKQLTDEVMSYYDFNFILKSDNFTIIGAKNTKNSEIVWNNNRVVEEEENDEKSN